MSVAPMKGVSAGALNEVQEGGTAVAFRPKVNFGAGFDVTDNATTNATDITVDLTEKQVNLSTEVTGTLPIANGGTNATTALQTMWIPSTAMKARTTNGAGNTTTESGTNKVMLDTLDFDPTTSEYAQFHVRMPKGWNESTVTAAFVWTTSTAATTSTCTWAIQAVALSDDDAVDTAFGTAQSVTDTFIASNDVHITSTTAAMTIAGIPTAEDWVVFQVYRDTADTLAVDCQLIGCTIYYTVDTYSDA